MIAFLNQIESLAPDHNLSIDLARVTTITTDAIVAMLATMQRHKTDVRGNLPRDNAAREILVQSGFFQDVKQTQALPQVVQGLIFREQNKKVQPDAAKLLIRKGTEIISGSPRRCPPAFRVLIESMVNTHNHASGFPGSLEPWWAMVYGDVARKRSCFTFVDTGVGIFRTLQVGLLRRIYQIFGKDDTEILREMLRGEVQSSTGLPYRGKGLPAIYEHQVKGRIKSLTIIANRVFADVAANDFRPLKNEFHGTLLYWEIE